MQPKFCLEVKFSSVCSMQGTKGLEHRHYTLCSCRSQTWQDAEVLCEYRESKGADEYSSTSYLLPVSCRNCYLNHCFVCKENLRKKCWYALGVLPQFDNSVKNRASLQKKLMEIIVVFLRKFDCCKLWKLHIKYSANFIGSDLVLSD